MTGWVFPVRLFHSRLSAGFKRRTVLPARLPESKGLICYGGDPHAAGSRWARVSGGSCQPIWCESRISFRRGGSGESTPTESLIDESNTGARAHVCGALGRSIAGRGTTPHFAVGREPELPEHRPVRAAVEDPHA